jgi:hypothetical protein
MSEPRDRGQTNLWRVTAAGRPVDRTPRADMRGERYLTVVMDNRRQR